MFRSLVTRLPRQASAAVTPSRLAVSLPRTYSTLLEDNTRTDNGGIDSRHFERILRGEFPNDFSGEVLPLNTARLSSENLGKLGPGSKIKGEYDRLQLTRSPVLTLL